MERRTFVSTLGKIGLGIAAAQFMGFPLSAANTIASEYKKWIWLVPETNTPLDTWRQRFEMMKSYGVHGIMAQVYSSHSTMYASKNLPVKADVLKTLIQAGKETGIEVHAWMWTMPNNHEETREKHPEWFAVNRLGQPSFSHPAYVDYYRFMCPNQQGVRDFLTQNVRELSAIEGLDGIHLDYIRFPDVILAEGLQPKYNIVQDKEYPQYDYCYCETCRKKFSEKTGIDPLKDMADPTSDKQWRQFRYDSITELVNELLVPEIKNGGKIASAAVFPNWESVRQQWSRWNLDAFFPMLYQNFYNMDIQWIGAQITKEIDAMNKHIPLYAGLYLPGLTPEQMSNAIEIARKSGASGYSLFSYNDITTAYWEKIGKKSD